jgi:hypothetical protein
MPAEYKTCLPRLTFDSMCTMNFVICVLNTKYVELTLEEQDSVAENYSHNSHNNHHYCRRRHYHHHRRHHHQFNMHDRLHSDNKQTASLHRVLRFSE